MHAEHASLKLTPEYGGEETGAASFPAVVMSLDHCQCIMKTMHLLSTPANAATLAKGIAQDRKGHAKHR